MQDATKTTTKSTDGVIPEGGFPAYLSAHLGAPLPSLRTAYDRRRSAACELLGCSLAEYNERAERFVAALLARHPDLAERPYVRTFAFSFASHVALRNARAESDKRAAKVRAVEAVTARVEALLFRAGARAA